MTFKLKIILNINFSNCVTPLDNVIRKHIFRTQDESQWIVRQSLLSHLQYLDASKSSTEDVSTLIFEIIIIA